MSFWFLFRNPKLLTPNFPDLTNKCRGLGVGSGRISVEDIAMTYAAKPANFKHAAMLITLNQRYYSGISELELYEVTRGIWVVGPRRDDAEIACAVFQGVIREVYEIDKWQEAGTDKYKTRDDDGFLGCGRWDFGGTVASDEIRDRYYRKSVKDIFWS